MLTQFNCIQLESNIHADDSSTNQKKTPPLQTLPLPQHHNIHLVLTETSLIVLDLLKNSVICRHVRDSEASIEKYGLNESFKIDPRGNIAILQTSKGYLMIYTLSGGSSSSTDGNPSGPGADASTEEVLTVYDKNGKLIQNGNVIEYKQDQFFQLNLLETPIYKVAQLRLKLVLFVKNGIRDYVALSESYVVLITSVDQQLMNLSTSSMNLLKLGDDVRKIQIFEDDQLFVVKDYVVRVYATTSFREFREIQIEIDDIQMINRDLFVGFKGCKLYYIAVRSKHLEVIKTIELQSEIKQVSVNRRLSLLAVLLLSKELQILSKFGLCLHTIDETIATKHVSFASQLLLLTDECNLKHADVWQFNGSFNRPILHDTASSYLRVYDPTNQFVNVAIPYANYVSLNNAPLQVQSNDKFIIVSNHTNFLMVYTGIDGIWDYFDLQPFRKFRNIVSFHILKNDWILLNCDNEEILIVDYFSNRLVYQQQFHSNTDRAVVVEVEGFSVLVGCNGKIHQFTYDSTKFKQVDVADVDLNLEKIVRWEDGYWLLTTTGEMYKYDIASKTLKPLSDQFANVENLAKINAEYTLVLSDNTVNLLRRSQPAVKIGAPPSACPFFFNFKKYQLMSMDDNVPVQYSYLKDLIKAEIGTDLSGLSDQTDDIYDHYKDSDSFEPAMEYLLYENVIMESNESTGEFATIKALIEKNESSKIQIISTILRKIELQQCLKIFEIFNINSKYLLNKCLEFKDFKNLLNLLIIFLSFDDISKDKLSEYLKIIYVNSLNNDDLLKSLFETLGFLKKFDKELLKSLIKEFEETK
ncbi:hypothetical protein WICPIJ_007391 [Wickerhamomyces pijperi]|uniref:RIC1 C-terminal alpha solenoid region domain-containing protein n=1 Tax=Wickerhamomyces pijperi TaxID=599730 RepID=A0A9P8TK54_WICPI|nr:hypothetical protein WICPIJ_007391 [Wickerhamomyces pijperi]